MRDLDVDLADDDPGPLAADPADVAAQILGRGHLDTPAPEPARSGRALGGDSPSLSLARGEGGGQQFPELDLGALSLEGWDAGFQAHTAIELQCGGERRLGFGQNGGQVAFLPGGVRTQQLGGSLGLLGAPVLLGIEGTGAYGVGLVCHLQAQNVTMIEVDWPDRMAAVGARRVASITGEKQVFGR